MVSEEVEGVTLLNCRSICVGVVSVFPPKGSRHAGFGGVASYAKNLAVCLSDLCKVVVFADRLCGVSDTYCEDDVWVCRCWDRGLFYPFRIFWNAARWRGRVDVFHVQHEYFLFGGVFSAVLFPFLLFLLKLFRKPVVVTLHGVISLSVIDREFLRDNMIGGFPFVFRLGALGLTRLIACFADALVVHDEFFRRVLVDEYGVCESKVFVVPHGVEEAREVINSDEAKRILGVGGKKVLLFFGYITGYKGLELLIDAFKFLKNDEDFVLFIAGGEHPRLRGKRRYREYLRRLRERARRVSDRIIFTGFVPEDKIPIYFSAADLVIFPYKAVMSSSGPINLAIAYRKPFLVSNVMNLIYGSSASFPLSAICLSKVIESFFNDNTFHEVVLEILEGKIENCRWDAVRDLTFSLYRRVLS